MSRESDDNLSSINSAYTDHGAILTANTEQFIIGQRVWVGGIRPGQIAFIGETHFAPGDWAGIVLDEPNGKNDGCVAGKRYFQCEAKRGIFSRLTRLTLAPLAGAQTPTSPTSKYSPERSRTVSPTASVQSSFLRSPGKDRPQVGDRVIVSSGFGSRPGILRYLGETKFASGNWCGIELDEATGKNDGAVDGIRYFECPPKYGVFVPIAKVSLSPSSKKSRLSRTGSRESLTSIGTMNSIATTNTSRMRMSAQRKFSTLRPSAVSPPKSQFSMQDMLRERQTQIEQLMIERDIDRHEAHNQGLQYQKRIDELEEKLKKLEKTLLKERKKNEELQSSVDEATFCGDELDAQSQVYKERIQDLERKVQTLSIAAGGGDYVETINAATEAATEEIKQLRAKLEKQTQDHQTKLSEVKIEGKKLQQEVEKLQLELQHATKNENNKQQNFNQELKSVKDSLSATENELKKRNSEYENLNDEFIKMTAELSVKKAECATMDELFKAQEMGNSEGKKMVEAKMTEISKLKEEINELRKRNENTESGLKQTKDELNLTNELKAKLEAQLKELKGGLTEKQATIQQFEAKIFELNKKCEESSNEKNQLKSEIENFHKTNEALKNTEGNLGIKLQEMEKAVEKANAELETDSNVKQELEAKLKDFESKLTSKQQEMEALKIEMEALEDKTVLLQDESTTTLKESSVQINELNTQIRALKQNLTEREQTYKQQEAEAEKQKLLLTEKLNELKSTNAALESTAKFNEQLQKELEAVVQKSKQLEIELKQSEEQKAQHQLELGDLTRKLETINAKCEALTTQNESLQQDVLMTKTSGTELQTELRRLNEENMAKQKSIGELETKYNEERHHFENQIVELQQKLGNITKDYEEKHEIAQKLKEELEAHKQQITALEEKLVKQELALSDSKRQHQNMQTKAKALSAQNEALQKDLTALRTTSTDSNAELMKLSQDVAAKQKAYEELLDKTNSERSALENELQVRQQRIDALCGQVEALTNELSSVNEESFKRFEALKEAQEKSGKQELEVGELNRRLESFQSKYAALETENANLHKELATLRNSSTDTNAEVLKLTAEISNKQKSLQELTDQSNAKRLELENKLQELTQRLVTLQNEVESLRQQLIETNEAKSTQETEFEKLKNKMLQEAKQELESLKATEAEQRSKLLAELEQQTQAAVGSKHSLDEAIIKLQKQIENLQNELQKSQAESKEQQTNLLKKIGALEAEKLKLIAELQGLQTENVSKLQNEETEKQKLIQQIDTLSKDLKEKEQHLQTLQSEATQAKLAQENSSSDLSQTQSEVKSLHEVIELINTDRDHQAKLSETDKRRIDELETLLEGFKKSNAQMSATNAQLVESLQIAESEKSEISQIFELFEMESDLTSTQLVEKLAFMKQELEQAQNKASSMDEALKVSREKSSAALQDAQNALAALQENATENSTKLSELQKERDFVVQNGQILEQEYNNLRKTLETYKAEKEQEILELCNKLTELQSKTKIASIDGSGDAISKLPTNGESSTQIDFLHSIIADMQQKNDSLKAKIQALEAIPTDFTQPNAFDFITKRKPAPRVFCDICDEFDKHETEDCPLQASDERDISPTPLASSDEKKERKIPPPRKYCDTCEVFGHETGECDGEECY